MRAGVSQTDGPLRPVQSCVNSVIVISWDHWGKVTPSCDQREFNTTGILFTEFACQCHPQRGRPSFNHAKLFSLWFVHEQDQKTSCLPTIVTSLRVCVCACVRVVCVRAWCVCVRGVCVCACVRVCVRVVCVRGVCVCVCVVCVCVCVCVLMAHFLVSTRPKDQLSSNHSNFFSLWFFYHPQRDRPSFNHSKLFPLYVFNRTRHRLGQAVPEFWGWFSAKGSTQYMKNSFRVNLYIFTLWTQNGKLIFII